MASPRQRRGRAAEDTVLRAGRRRGLRCLARNFHCRQGELDLVLAGGDGLVVVEVRYRARADFGRAAETVTAAKQGRIIQATRAFLAAYPRHAERPLRFDVVGIEPDGTLDWIENAFQADGA